MALMVCSAVRPSRQTTQLWNEGRHRSRRSTNGAARNIRRGHAGLPQVTPGQSNAPNTYLYAAVGGESCPEPFRHHARRRSGAGSVGIMERVQRRQWKTSSDGRTAASYRSRGTREFLAGTCVVRFMSGRTLRLGLEYQLGSGLAPMAGVCGYRRHESQRIPAIIPAFNSTVKVLQYSRIIENARSRRRRPPTVSERRQLARRQSSISPVMMRQPADGFVARNYAVSRGAAARQSS